MYDWSTFLGLWAKECARVRKDMEGSKLSGRSVLCQLLSGVCKNSRRGDRRVIFWLMLFTLDLFWSVCTLIIAHFAILVLLAEVSIAQALRCLEFFLHFSGLCTLSGLRYPKGLRLERRAKSFIGPNTKRCLCRVIVSWQPARTWPQPPWHLLVANCLVHFPFFCVCYVCYCLIF